MAKGDAATQEAPVEGQVVSESTELIPIHEVREAMLTGRPVEIQDTDAVAREIAMQLMNADTPEALFAVPGTTSPRELFGESLILQRVRFMPSTIDEAKCPVYALMDLVKPTGELLTVPCGGQALMVQCLRAVEEGWLPWAVELVEVGRERAGRNRPIYLQTATR